MTPKQGAYGLIVLGAVLALGALLADVVGYGMVSGFGAGQIISVIAGVLLIGIGVYLGFVNPPPESS